MAQHPTRATLVVRAAVICALLALSLLPTRFAAASSTSLFVATNGLDTNPGTNTAPFATLQKALEVAQPGAMIYVGGGLYTLDKPILTVAKATPGSGGPWINVQPMTSQVPVFECKHIPLGANGAPQTCLTVRSSYIDIKGLEIKNSPNSGIAVMSGSYVRIGNNHVYGSKTQGIYVSGEYGTTDNIVVESNIVHNNALNNPVPVTTTTEGWASGIGIQHQATNIRVTNNTVYHNNGEGIGISSRVNTVVSGNIIHDNFSTNMYVNGARNATVERNFIYTSDIYLPQPAQSLYFRYNAPANGISVANEHDDPAATLTNLTIRNNIVVGGRYAFYYGSFLAAGGMKNSSIANNTFYTNAFYPHAEGNSATVKIESKYITQTATLINQHSGVKFFNNAAMQTTAGAIREISSVIPTTGIEFYRNGWYSPNSTSSLPGQGPNDVTGDPKFLSAGSLTTGTNPQPLADFYKLTAVSPLINAATATNGPANDFWGDARPQGAGPEIGADEYAPTVAFSQGFYIVDEGTSAVITIRFSQPLLQQVSIGYSTSDGSAVGGGPCKNNCPISPDYTTSVGVIYFAAGQTEASFSIPIYADTLDESTENFHVNLSSQSGLIGLGSPSTATVFINGGNLEDQ